jgi:hypothetical protein
MRKLTTCAMLLLLGSCQTWGPTWSEVTGVRYDVTSLGVGPVLINQVDGSSPGNTPGQPIRITSGRHTIVLQVIPPSSVLGLVNLEQIVLDAAPCKPPPQAPTGNPSLITRNKLRDAKLRRRPSQASVEGDSICAGGTRAWGIFPANHRPWDWMHHLHSCSPVAAAPRAKASFPPSDGG